MKETCTVVPIHYPKFNYAIDLLNSHSKNIKSDLYFIFSSQEEYDIFLKITLKIGNLNYKKIILPEEINKYSNIITNKKFYAVNILSDQYKYISVFDCESLFVKPFNTDEIYKKIDDTKIFKSNRRRTSDHLKKLAVLMGYENNKVLLEETDNFLQYWWFNDICVYNTELFSEFYAWFLKKDNYKEMMNEFSCFDYLLYSMWLICNKNYKLKKYLQNIICNGAMIETNYDNNKISNIFQSYQDRNINHKEIEHIKVQIMLDRDINHCLSEGKLYEDTYSDGR